MNEGGDFLDPRFKHAVGARVGHHQGAELRRMLFSLLAQIIHVDVAVGIGLHHHHREARHHGARGIGAVCRLRNETHCAVRVTTRLVVGANHQQPGVLPL